jgi:Concanavalin A-like lectin/glucanases superfamily
MHLLKAWIEPRQLLRVFFLALALFTLNVSAQNAVVTNRALKLDGQGSYVELPTDIFRDLTQATVEVWAKWKEFGWYSRVFEFGAGYQSVSVFNHMTNSDLRFNIYPRFAKNDPSSMFTATARGLLRTNEWIHLAAVSGPGGMQLYVNGRLAAQHTNALTFADIKAAQTNVLGRGLARGPLDKDFKGDLDEVRVWDHRRSVAQIRDGMFKRMHGTEDGLTHLWNFDDGTASDSGPNFHHGKLIGKARVGSSDLDLAPPVAPVVAVVPPPTPAPVVSSPPPVAAAVPIQVAVTAPPSGSNAAVWWIAGALISLVAMLACLLMMLRRSGLGTPKQLLPGSAAGALTAGGAQNEQAMKERALADLTDFAKQSLVQGLYSQRAALLETHQQAQAELAQLEARVVALHLPERIQAYETRIAELEGQLTNRSDELRELTLATLHVLREKLEEEKQKEPKPGRFN